METEKRRVFKLMKTNKLIRLLNATKLYHILNKNNKKARVSFIPLNFKQIFPATPVFLLSLPKLWRFGMRMYTVLYSRDSFYRLASQTSWRSIIET